MPVREGWEGIVVGVFMPEASTLAHLFVGATLTATSVGITTRVLKDLVNTFAACCAVTASGAAKGRGSPRERRAAPLLDDLIRPREHRRRDREAKGLRSFEVDDQLEFRRLLNGQVRGLNASQNLVDVLRGAGCGFVQTRTE